MQENKKISKLVLGRGIKKVAFYDLKETNLMNIPIIAMERKPNQPTKKKPNDNPWNGQSRTQL